MSDVRDLSTFEPCSDGLANCAACRVMAYLRACDLRTDVKREPVHDCFHWVLHEIDTDGRVPHQENFEIVPAYFGYNGWFVFRHESVSEVPAWAITVIKVLDHPMWGSGFSRAGTVP